MQTREVPPSRKSIWAQGEVKPFGPLHDVTCSGLGPGFPDEIERGVEETGNDEIALF